MASGGLLHASKTLHLWVVLNTELLSAGMELLDVDLLIAVLGCISDLKCLAEGAELKGGQGIWMQSCGGKLFLS